MHKWISLEVQKKSPTRAFLSAWYSRVKPWFSRYLSGVAARVDRQARGEAGGRTRLARTSGTERVILSGLTVDTVQELNDAELKALHRRCHELGERVG